MRVWWGWVWGRAEREEAEERAAARRERRAGREAAADRERERVGLAQEAAAAAEAAAVHARWARLQAERQELAQVGALHACIRAVCVRASVQANRPVALRDDSGNALRSIVCGIVVPRRASVSLRRRRAITSGRAGRRRDSGARTRKVSGNCESEMRPSLM